MMPRTVASVTLVLVLAATGCASRSDLLSAAMDRDGGEESREALLELQEQEVFLSHQDLETILRENRDAGARILAAEMLGQQLAAPAVAELQETARRDRAWPVRAAALRALSRIQGSDAAEELQSALRGDPDPQTRLDALRELRVVWLDRREPLTAALEQALQDPAPIVRLQASHYLAKLTGLTAAPDLQSWQEVRSQ
jgi:HEAT repeat protein